MATKKDPAKPGPTQAPGKQDPQVNPPKDQTHSEEHTQPQMHSLESEGFGRFEYRNGTVYEGQWKMIKNLRMKHGEGVLIHAGTTAHEQGNEEYRGTWSEDKMNGFGVYKYTSGAIYSGEWKDGKQNGRGVYEFPDGCIYDGEWKDHRMHGEGIFIDREGNKWEGEYVEGVYQSKMQKHLKIEKGLKKKEDEILKSVLTFFTRFTQAFATSDKKTYKENLIPFFAVQDEIQLYVKEPYAKFEERPPDKWNELMTLFMSYTSVNVLRHNMNAKIIDPNLILSAQFNGAGQIVEFAKDSADKHLQLVLCNVFENNWHPPSVQQMTEIIDYRKMFENKCQEFDMLNGEFLEFKETSKMIEIELENDMEALNKKLSSLQNENTKLKDEVKEMRERREKDVGALEKKLEIIKNEKLLFDKKQKSLENKIVELENENEALQKQHRESENVISDLEIKIDKTLEELAIVQTELEDNKNKSQEQIERLKQKLLETDDELKILQSSSFSRSETKKKYESSEEETTAGYESDIVHPLQNNEKMINKFNKVNEPNVEEINGISHKFLEDKRNSEMVKQLYQNARKKHSNKSMNDVESRRKIESSELVVEHLSKKKDLENRLKTYNNNINDMQVNNKGFNKSLQIVNTLIKDLDDKIQKIKEHKLKNNV